MIGEMVLCERQKLLVFILSTNMSSANYIQKFELGNVFIFTNIHLQRKACFEMAGELDIISLVSTCHEARIQ